MIKVYGKEIDMNHFPDGTLLVKYDVSPFYEHNRANFYEIEWKFENNEEMVALMYLTKHLRSKGIANISLLMPYIPNARQDRVKSEEDIFTLKYFAEFINSLHFSKVCVTDPHSIVSEALIDNICIVKPNKYIDIAINNIEKETGRKPTLTFFPDEGAMKRYSNLISTPYCFGIKRRDWETGVIQGLDVSGSMDLVKNSTVLIIDDICSRGDTFLFSARKLKELGANKIYLFVSHCENTILEGELLTCNLIEKVFTTDSLITIKHDKIEIFSEQSYRILWI